MYTLDQIVRQMVTEKVEQAKIEITKELLAKFDRTLNVVELADYIGVGEKKLYNMCAAKQIPHIKIGKTIRFKLSEIDNWLQENKVC